jgi:cyclopropane fatty-acyl-phospholipid synthase-like methyltransferase
MLGSRIVPPEAIGSCNMKSEQFEEYYQGGAPWDIDHAQPAFVALEQAGTVQGSVLDVGCGTGENALYFASRGHDVWGIDFVPWAVEQARARAAQRASSAQFHAGDALALETLGRTFDNVIDCGLFHTFTDEERPVFVAGLEKVIRAGGSYHMLCFSDQEPPGEGPRRVSEQEIRATFKNGWVLSSIKPTHFDVAQRPGGPRFSPGGPKAWIATLVRQA